MLITLRSCVRVKKRRSEEAKKRRSEEAKKRRSEEAKKRRSEKAKKRSSEEVKLVRSEPRQGFRTPAVRDVFLGLVKLKRNNRDCSQSSGLRPSRFTLVLPEVGKLRSLILSCCFLFSTGLMRQKTKSHSG